MTTSTPGLHLALMGIDGVGKTTLTRELVELARTQGVPVQTVSWRSVVEEDGDPTQYPRDELRKLWVQSFRANFSGATMADGSSVQLPENFEHLNELGGTEYLNGAPIDGMKASGALASAWIELAANTLLHRIVIKELVDSGYLVLQESYGYKHLIKLFAFAEHLAPESVQAPRSGRHLATDYFGRVLRPDVGVYVSGSPELALRWRRQQSGVGTFEKFATPGTDAESSFLRLQERTMPTFETFAERHSWARVDMVDGPREENWRRAAEVLSGTMLAELLDLTEVGGR